MFWSALTIVKINPSRVSESGVLNTTDALLLLGEIEPDIVPVNVIMSNVAMFSTVRVKVLLTAVDGDDGGEEAVVNVPRLTLAGVVADDSPNEV
jgi:hypothetical protein